jgi:hypothetical protein
MLDQAVYDYTRQRANDVANIGAQKNFAGALGNETSEVQKLYAPALQKQQQDMGQYQSLMDLTTQLAQVKQSYDTANANGQLTDDLKTQLGQKADMLRAQLKAIPNVPQDIGTGTTQQLMQQASPLIEGAYTRAITPALLPQEQMLSAALNTAKASHGALSPEQAIQYGQGLSKNFETQQATLASRLQTAHNKVIINHLENQMGEALQNKDYGTAAKISMALEPYGIKTPEWIGKMAVPEKPVGHVTLSNGNLGIINADGSVTDTGTGVMVSAGRSGGGVGRATGIGSRGGVGRTAAAWGPKASYGVSGQLDNDIAAYNKWADAPDEDKAKYQRAANLASARINAWRAAGNDVEGLSDYSSSSADEEDNDAQSWQDKYNNMLADIWNSTSDAQRQQKINYYDQQGALDQFRASNFKVDNDLAYVTSNGESENQPAEGTEEAEQQGYDNAEDWQGKYDNMLADIWNSTSDAQREQKINWYDGQGYLQQFRDSNLDVDRDIDYIRQQQSGGSSDDGSAPEDAEASSPSTDEDWYNRTSNSVSNNHPDWSDEDVSNYMTYLINNNTDYDGS